MKMLLVIFITVSIFVYSLINYINYLERNITKTQAVNDKKDKVFFSSEEYPLGFASKGEEVARFYDEGDWTVFKIKKCTPCTNCDKAKQ